MLKFKTIPITSDTTIHWYLDYHVNALNLDDLIYETASDFCGDDNMIIVIDENHDSPYESLIDEYSYHYLLKEYRDNGYRIDYALYTKDCHYLCGFVCWK